MGLICRPLSKAILGIPKQYEPHRSSTRLILIHPSSKHARIRPYFLISLPPDHDPGRRTYSAVADKAPVLNEFVSGLAIRDGDLLAFQDILGLGHQNQPSTLSVVSIRAQRDTSVVEPRCNREDATIPTTGFKSEMNLSQFHSVNPQELQHLPNIEHSPIGLEDGNNFIFV